MLEFVWPNIYVPVFVEHLGHLSTLVKFSDSVPLSPDVVDLGVGEAEKKSTERTRTVAVGGPNNASTIGETLLAGSTAKSQTIAKRSYESNRILCTTELNSDGILFWQGAWSTQWQS